jgi:DNA (cytosine-5)-methyltransferase 1
VKRIQAGLDQLGGEKPMVLTVNHGGHDGRAFPAMTWPARRPHGEDR